jgi:hypothetical protein
VGLRFRVTEKNALGFDWSYSPNRYELTGSLDLPGYGDVVPDQLTQWLNIGALNYVRYLSRLGKWQPFVTAGPALARFSGLTLDANRWGGNFGAGWTCPSGAGPRCGLRREILSSGSRTRFVVLPTT